MARDHARLKCSIWSDSDFTSLPASAQRTYFLALSQPGLTYAGVVSYTPGRWSRLAAGTSPAAIRKDIRTLEDAGYVVVDEGTEELLISTFVKHDGIMKQPHVARAMVKAANGIVSPAVREAFRSALLDLQRERLADPPKPKEGEEPKQDGWSVEGLAELLSGGPR